MTVYCHLPYHTGILAINSCQSALHSNLISSSLHVVVLKNNNTTPVTKHIWYQLEYSLFLCKYKWHSELVRDITFTEDLPAGYHHVSGHNFLLLLSLQQMEDLNNTSEHEMRWYSMSIPTHILTQCHIHIPDKQTMWQWCPLPNDPRVPPVLKKMANMPNIIVTGYTHTHTHTHTHSVYTVLTTHSAI